MRIDVTHLRRLGLLGLAAGLLAGASPTWADDADLKQRIELRLENKKLTETANIDVAVEQGSAVLTGLTTTVYDRNRAEQAARKEADEVDNRIQVQPDGEYSDAEVVEAIRKTILRYPYYSIFDSVTFGVENGHVLLSGSTLHPWRRNEIEKRVSKVKGIRELQSEITVQSVSIFDDRLRRRLANRIYRDPRFIQYANRTNPPIKIIVSKGKVTLAGYVTSPVEQALLGHIARGFLSFGVDNQLKVDSDSPEEKPSGSASAS